MVGDPNSPVNCRFSETGPASMAYGGAGAWLKESWRSGVLRDLPRRPSGGQGWTDGQPVLAAVLLNVPGFGCAEDLERMAADLGLCRTARRYEPRILGVGRKQLGRRHPGGRQWTFPSPRALPDRFARPPGRAGGTGAAQGRGDCAAACGFAGRVWRGVPAPVRKTSGMAWYGLRSITLDLDSTIIPSGKREALRPTARRMGNVRGRRGINRRMRLARNWG